MEHSVPSGYMYAGIAQIRMTNWCVAVSKVGVGSGISVNAINCTDSEQVTACEIGLLYLPA